ncbi:MAG: hypothetical protein AB1758_12695 [Candidatus Eremiobacterota bacterium]
MIWLASEADMKMPVETVPVVSPAFFVPALFLGLLALGLVWRLAAVEARSRTVGSAFALLCWGSALGLDLVWFSGLYLPHAEALALAWGVGVVVGLAGVLACPRRR